MTRPVALAALAGAALAACAGEKKPAADSTVARDSAAGPRAASTPVHGRDSVLDIEPGDPRRQVRTVPADTGRGPPR